MFGPEDCRHGGHIDFEQFGVGGCIDSIVVASCRHNNISHMDILQRTIADRRQCLHSSTFADRCSYYSRRPHFADHCANLAGQHDKVLMILTSDIAWQSHFVHDKGSDRQKPMRHGRQISGQCTSKVV